MVDSCFLLHRKEIDQTRQVLVRLHETPRSQPVDPLGHIHPAPGQPPGNECGQLTIRHGSDCRQQHLAQCGQLGIPRAVIGEWLEHLRKGKPGDCRVFILHRHVVQVLIGQLLGTQPHTVHRGEHVGDRFRTIVKRAEVPFRPTVLRVAVDPRDGMTHGWQPGKKIECQCAAEPGFVQSLERLHPGAFILSQTGEEGKFVPRGHPPLAEPHDVLQGREIVSAHQTTESSDDHVHEVLVGAQPEIQVRSCLVGTALFETIDIDPSQFMEHLRRPLPLRQSCHVLPHGSHVPGLTLSHGGVRRRLEPSCEVGGVPGFGCQHPLAPLPQQRRSANLGSDLFVVQSRAPQLILHRGPAKEFDCNKRRFFRFFDGLFQTPPAEAGWNVFAKELVADDTMEEAVLK